MDFLCILVGHYIIQCLRLDSQGACNKWEKRKHFTTVLWYENDTGIKLEETGKNWPWDDTKVVTLWAATFTTSWMCLLCTLELVCILKCFVHVFKTLIVYCVSFKMCH